MTYIISQNENFSQLNNLKTIFNQLDQNGDGQLQLDEIHVGLKQAFGDVKGNLAIFQDILHALDRNHNGVVDYTEFITAATEKENILTENNLKFAFKVFDKDGNGYISK